METNTAFEMREKALLGREALKTIVEICKSYHDSDAGCYRCPFMSAEQDGECVFKMKDIHQITVEEEPIVRVVL